MINVFRKTGTYSVLTDLLLNSYIFNCTCSRFLAVCIDCCNLDIYFLSACELRESVCKLISCEEIEDTEIEIKDEEDIGFFGRLLKFITSLIDRFFKIFSRFS